MTLQPEDVADIARGTYSLSRLTDDDARLVGFHGLAPALCGPSTVEAAAQPPWLLARARQDARRAMQVAASSTRCQAILAQGGIPSLVYKGAPLAYQTTGDLLSRSMADVDVLVDPSEAAAAAQLLVDAGHRPLFERAGLGADRLSRYAECETTLTGVGTSIDLHWRIDSGHGYFRASFAELWERRAEVSFNGLNVYTLGPVDALLVTAVHGCRSFWLRWKWIIDAVRQMDALPDEQWSVAKNRARALGAGRALALTAAVVAAAGGGSPPGRRPGAWALAKGVEWVEWSEKSEVQPWSEALRRRRARLDAADGVGTVLDDTLRFTARQLLEWRTGKLRYKNEVIKGQSR